MQQAVIAEEVRKALRLSGNSGDVELILASQVVVSGHCRGVFAPHFTTDHLPNHWDVYCENFKQG